jgi:hypothetical protein
MTPQTLLSKMAQEFDINKSTFESDQEWVQRVVLSACGAWLLHMLTSSESSQLSIVFAKDKLKEKLSAYMDLFHYSNNISEVLIDNIAEYILRVYSLSGWVYRTPYHIHRAVEKTVFTGGIEWVRSPVSFEKYSFSGLGLYTACDDESGKHNDLFNICGLSAEETPASVLKKLIKKRHWQPVTIGSSREYLNVYRKYGEGYYSAKQPYSDTVILAREHSEYNFRYILVHKDTQYELQPWEQEESYQEYVALALMKQHSFLNAKVSIGEELTKLELSHSLPSPEEALLQLYAWPHSLDDLRNRWFFSFAPVTYPVIKSRLSYLGFDVKEEQP